MRYLDTGSRDPEQSLAVWLEHVLKSSIAELRLQSGFFSANGLGLLIPTLEAAAKTNSHTHILLGSNDGVTLRDDVEIIARAMGLPRTNGWLGIVSFAGAYFHAKAFHIVRADGSQAAVVGSGNLTSSGLALHVEAAVSLDTRDGDPPQELNKIATSIDAWFTEKRDGLTIVQESKILAKLVQDGVLSVAPPAKPAGALALGAPAQKNKKPGLKPLVTLPAVKGVYVIGADEGEVDQSATKTTGAAQAGTTDSPPANYDPTAGNPVLIAEIPAGSKRWNQANFSKNVFVNFFGASTKTSREIHLYHRKDDGSVGHLEVRPSVSVKSHNYRFELDAAAGLPYPAKGRPIGVFVKVAPSTFQYRLLMPGKDGHDTVAAYLGKISTSAPGFMAREIVTVKDLKKVWPDSPLWKE